MSSESWAVYYRLVDEAVRDRLGGLHSADVCFLRTIDFAQVEELPARGSAWDGGGPALLATEGRQPSRAAGAELLVLCTNTMHKVRDDRGGDHGFPFVHIADTSADASPAAGLRAVGLLATALHDGAGLLRRPAARQARPEHSSSPDAADRRDRPAGWSTRSSCVGVVRRRLRGPSTGGSWRDLCAERGARRHPVRLHRDRPAGAPSDSSVPVFDTTRLHRGCRRPRARRAPVPAFGSS